MFGRALRWGVDQARAVARDLLIVSDAAGWAIDEQARRTAESLPAPLRATVVRYVPSWIAGKTVHFIHRYAALEDELAARLARRNRVLLTWTHGGALAETTPELDALVRQFERLAPRFDRVHVQSSLYVPVVERLGVPPDRVTLLPLGVDVDRFVPVDGGRRRVRAKLGLRPETLYVGSFQRDGDDAPKLVKGPDLLVEFAARLRARVPGIVLLLAGPARGWIRRALDARGVPYHYLGVVPVPVLVQCFQACDLYVITSREEGGPMALLEALSSGVPVVSSRVGMAVDVIDPEVNGELAAVGDVQTLVDAASRLLEDNDRAVRVARAARATALRYDWRTLGKLYAERLYAAPAGGRARNSTQN